MRCLVVDDEKLAREELKYMLKDYDDIEVVAEASNAIEALKINEDLDIDLMFLDIKMPKISGIELAQILMNKQNPPKIIFVTAYDEFAIDAFRVNAIDYLLKPLDKNQLKESLERKIFVDDETIFDDISSLKEIIFNMKVEKNTVNKITVHSNNKLIPIDYDEIIYITVEDKTTIVRTKEDKYEINYTLNDIFEKLNDNRFFRSHKSFIINIDFIDAIEPWFNSTLNLKMKHIKEIVPVSRSNVKKFKSIMTMA